MAPKVQDKARKEQKEKMAVDKTFGMKNKNKSKQVQKYIKQITSNLTGQSNKAEQDARREKDLKEAELKKKALMASLFNNQTDKKGRAFDPVAKKIAKQREEDAIAAGKKMKEEDKKKIIEGVANSIRLTDPKGVRMSELGGHPIVQALKEKMADVWRTLSLLLFIKANDAVFWVSDEEDNNPIIRCKDDVDAEVAPDDRPMEEILEERRAALPPGGTPVTSSTFLAWKEKKEAERLALVEEHRKERAGKTKGGGLVGMSGRDLFTYDSSLFVDADDEGAVDADAYEHDEDAPEDFDDGPKLGQRSAAIPEDDEGEEDDMSHMFADPPPDEDEEEAEDSGAAGSAGALVKGEVPINKDLFLGGADDLPDDLDDLDDD